MVNCAAIEYTDSSKNKKNEEVKGWHWVPYKESDRATHKKWLQGNKRTPPYPEKKENFVICGLHFEENCFKRD